MCIVRNMALIDAFTAKAADSKYQMRKAVQQEADMYLEEVLLLKELRPFLGIDAAAQADKGNIMSGSGSCG